MRLGGQYQNLGSRCDMNEERDTFNNPPAGLYDRWLHLRDFLLFVFMGSGANFVLPTALVQEVPYFENVLPEKLCIATYMNLMTSLGLITMLTYLYINNYVYKIPYNVSVPFMLVTSSLTSFVVAGVYPITIGKVSVLLYICCFIGGSVGAMSSVIMNPFMTVYTNDSISAVRTGGSGFTLLCALVAAAQSPGSSHQTFSARVYLVIFGILLGLAIPAYMFIMWRQLGQRGAQKNDDIVVANGHKANRMNSVVTNFQSNLSINPMVDGSFANKSMQSFDITHNQGPLMSSLETIESASVEATSLVGIDTQPIMDYIARHLVSDAMDDQHPWLRRTVPYMMVVGWMNFNTWGILSAMIPFAVSNAYNSDGSGNLGIAYQVAGVLFVMGDLSTIILKLNLLKGTIVFTILSIVIYIAAMGTPGFHSAASGPIIIVLFAIVRFLESHLVTVTLRAIATDFPLVHRELASRAVGISNQVCTTIGAVLSTLVVYLMFSCND